ncbi:dynein light chain LC8-type [Schistosoma bovis]|uniref:Dynein light chain n=1 Tax=Schistosoma bovis TaxID=6184 RepID=A0A430Q261_SCHBO|nr:dynein light chain LC8-type [Schistosoma bovis]
MNNSVIKNADMSHEMQKRALAIGMDSVRKYELEKDIADHLKKEFDTRYGPTWHCIKFVLKVQSHEQLSLSSLLCASLFTVDQYSVTHEPDSFIYFYVEKYAVLLYKSG